MIKHTIILFSCVMGFLFLTTLQSKTCCSILNKKGSVPHMERTCAIIKPDAVSAKHSGDIIRLIELNGFSVVRMQKMHWTLKQGESFYGIHKGKPFFDELVAHMVSGPLIVMALEKENAIKEWRDLMGTTNPATAGVGTLRRMFAQSITRNAVHGSDSVESAHKELSLFFSDL